MLRPCDVLAVHPPGEVQHQLVEDALEEGEIAAPAALLAIDLEHAPRRPGVHRRVDVAERPLVGGDLAVRVHVPVARQQDELVLGELGIDQRERDAVEREVPGRVPGILPLVRHRDDVGVVEVAPVGVAPVLALGRRRRLVGIAVEPLGHVVVVELLASRSCRRTPGAGRCGRRHRRARSAGRRRTRRPPPGAASNTASKSANGASAPRRASRRRICARSPRPDLDGDRGRADLGAPCGLG